MSVRVGGPRLPIHVERLGVVIPEDMVRGASEAAFYRVAETDLVPRIVHELMRVLPG